MSPKLKKISFIKLIFIVFFTIYHFAYCLFSGLDSIKLDAIIQLSFILILIIYRIRKNTSLFFIPDIFLFALTYLWATSIIPGSKLWLTNWKLFFISALLFNIPQVIKLLFLKETDFNIKSGIALSLIFVISFSTMLKATFSGFNSLLYTNTLINTLIFFGFITFGKYWSDLLTNR